MKKTSTRFAALAAAATAFGAMLLPGAPASAQFIAPWGVWAGPPAFFPPDDDAVQDSMIPPHVVRNILRSRGYRLMAAPRLAGDDIVALGENARGRRMRFVIDAYSGALMRQVALGRGEPGPYRAQRGPDDLALGGPVDGRPLADSDLSGRPAPERKARPKHRISRETAARRPTPHAPAPKPPAPSQATLPPAAPAPAAPAPAVEPPKASAAAPSAPAAADKTPLAPDATRQAKPQTPPAAEQAAVPATPSPADKPPLAPDAAKDAVKDAAPAAKPTDIGPRVQAVPSPARASEAAADAKPAASDAKPGDGATK